MPKKKDDTRVNDQHIQPSPIESMSAEEMRRMLYELQKHQVELEKQIEEFRQLLAADEKQTLLSIVEEKNKLSALIDGISDEVWFTDKQGVFTLANPTALREFGLACGKPIEVEKLVNSLEIFRSDGTPRPFEEAPPLRALAGEIVRNQEEIVRTPGSSGMRYRQVSSSPVKDAAGNIIGAVSIVQDITDRKHAEETLMNYNVELERSVNERTAVAENRARKLQALSRLLIRAEEKERQRIAYVLHEDLQQTLIAARMALHAGIQQVKDTAPQVPLSVVDRMLEDAIAGTRELVHEIVPPALYDGGIQDAIIWLSRQMRERYDFSVEVTVDEQITTIDDEVSICAYQAVRELLLNVEKHAGVKHAEVIFVVLNKGRFKITVCDEGAGFMVSELSKPNGSEIGFGLFNIRERIEGFGGGMEIVSTLGKGTSISLFLPMNGTKAGKKKSNGKWGHGN